MACGPRHRDGRRRLSERIRRRLPEDVRRRLEADGQRVGDAILELPAAAADGEPWRSHPELLARSPEARSILFGALDASDATSLVWLGRDDPVPEAVVRALEPSRPVLASRAELARNAKRRWYETAWPRDRALLRRPKVIALYRTDRGRFALDEDGTWQPSNKTTVCVGREEDAPVALLCGLLDSELLDLWFAVRGKTPRDVWRNYEPKPMNRMPIVAGAARGPAPPELMGELRADASMPAAALAQLLPESPPALAAVVELGVRALAANRLALLGLRDIAPELGRIIKDPWDSRRPAIDEAAVIAVGGDTVSVRIDPGLRIDLQHEGPLGRPALEAGTLVLRRGRQVRARVSGDPERVDLLARVLGAAQVDRAALEATVLPRDLALHRAEVGAVTSRVDLLLDAGRALVEVVERAVCRLYAVPADLEEAVVAHAVERARRRAPEDGAERDLLG